MSTADTSRAPWFDAGEGWDGTLPAAFALAGAAGADRRDTLRRLVARALDVEAGEVAVQHRQGLPPRVDAPATTGLCVSLARRGRFAAAAIARSPIGVDVETVDDGGEVPWNVLHAHETAYLRALARADVGPAFARLWSLKEAYVKARGQGFAREPASFCVVLDGPERASVLDPEAAAFVARTSTTWRQADGTRAAFSCVVLHP